MTTRESSVNDLLALNKSQEKSDDEFFNPQESEEQEAKCSLVGTEEYVAPEIV